MTEFKTTILQKIKEEKLHQRPKLYFTLKVGLFALLALAVLAISIFLFNFILFSIRINSEDELLGFGPRGIWAFFRFFPWAWLVVDFVAIGFLQKLVRKFKFGYRMPVAYLLLGILAATIIVGLILDRATDWNDRILRRAEGHRTPSSFDRFYRGARQPVPPRNGVCLCTVVDLSGNKMVVADNRFGTTTLLTVILPPHDSLATSSGLMKGDTVFIAGEPRNGILEAFGVRKINLKIPN